MENEMLINNHVPKPEIRDGIRRKLFKSHLTVAAIGVGLLCVALVSTLYLRSHILRLSKVRGPTAQSASLALSGVQRSLAALRGWVALADPAFREERKLAWTEEILPAVNSLQSLSFLWTHPEDRIRLEEGSRLLQDLKEWQWWIEDVAQTPGNLPARLMLMRELQPLVPRLGLGPNSRT